MKLAELQVLHLEGDASKLAAGRPGARRAAARQAWVIETCQRTVIVGLGRDARAQIAERLPAAARCAGHVRGRGLCLPAAIRLRAGKPDGRRDRGVRADQGILAGPERRARACCRASSTAGCRRCSRTPRRFAPPTCPSWAALPTDRRCGGCWVRRARDRLCWWVPGSSRKAVAPWLECGELLLWNRTADKAHELARRVQRTPSGTTAAACSRARSNSELEAWSCAGDVIVCVPADADARCGAHRRLARAHGARRSHRAPGLGRSARLELGRACRA